jgi:chemotaxis protein MotB
MPKNTWWIASLLTSLVLLGLAGLYSKQQKTELEKTRAEVEAIRKNAEETNAQAERLLKGLEESKERIETLMKEKDEVTQAQKSLESQMRSALESKEVTISELQGRLTVNILDRILFDSGEAVLKPDGQAVLDKIAQILGEFPKRQVQVVGHTDNVPIRWNPKNPFQTNWELSAGRAIAAVRYLTEKANVDPHRLSAVGYGEFHPIADNSTAEGRAKNRRIAIVIAPEEIVPTDIPAAQSLTNAVTQVSTNAVTATSTNSTPASAKTE